MDVGRGVVGSVFGTAGAIAPESEEETYGGGNGDADSNQYAA